MIAAVQRWGRQTVRFDVLPGLVAVALGTALAHVIAAPISGASPLVTGVVLGAIAANLGTVPESWRPGVQFAARRLLRLGVVLLGLRLSIGDVTALGAPALAVVISTVAATFFGTQWIGRRMGMPADQSLLIATGFSICGASAIAAIEGSTDAPEEDVAVAIGLVTLCGSLAMLAIPLAAGPLQLDGAEFGAWVGASVHDVAQVVATASSGGAAALATATVVKLTRVTMLAPIIGLVNARRRKQHGQGVALLPMFVVGFLTMVGVRSAGLLSQPIVDGARMVESIVLTAALVGLGVGVDFRALRCLGRRPIVLGLLSWLLVATVSYLGVLLTAW